MAGRPLQEADALWHAGERLFGPKFWGTNFTDEHLKRIYQSPYYLELIGEYTPNKKHGGKIKKKPTNRYARGGKAYTYAGGFRKTK